MQFGPHAGETVLVSPMVGRALLADGRARAVPPETPTPAPPRAGSVTTASPASIETRDPVITPPRSQQQGHRRGRR